MSAPATQSVPNDDDTQGRFPHSEFALKVYNIPVVHDSVNGLYAAIEKNSYAASAYRTAEGLTLQALRVARPITSRFAPQFLWADRKATDGLDYVQAKIPLLAAPTDEVLAKTRLQQAADTIARLQHSLQNNIDAIAAKGSEGTKTYSDRAQGLASAIFAEVDKVKVYVSGLPSHLRERVSPLTTTLDKSYKDVKAEMFKNETPPVTKFKSIVNYLSYEFVPALTSAIQKTAIQTKEDAASAADGVKESVKENVKDSTN